MTITHDNRSPEGDLDSVYARVLAAVAPGSEEPLDYSVLSVGVTTLALLLCVELIRHRLDHAAQHRPFFKTVLEQVYSECKLLSYDRGRFVT